MRVLLLLMVAILITFNLQVVNAKEGMEKYPPNANKQFPTADQFYNDINRAIYTEPPNPEYSLVVKVLYKDVNSVFNRVPYHLTGVGDGIGFNPERVVYIYVSGVSKNNNVYYQHAVFDAETKRKISGASNFNELTNSEQQEE